MSVDDENWQNWRRWKASRKSNGTARSGRGVFDDVLADIFGRPSTGPRLTVLLGLKLILLILLAVSAFAALR